MKTIATGMAVAVLGVAFGATMSRTAPVKMAEPPTISNQDRAFMIAAAHGGVDEIEGGKIAAEKGNDFHKAFGQQMVQDHSAAADQLKKIADDKAVSLPSDPDAAAAKMLTALRSLSGAGFDKNYQKFIAVTHNSALKAFNLEAKSGTDPDVKAFAVKTIPTIEMHIKELKSMKVMPM